MTTSTRSVFLNAGIGSKACVNGQYNAGDGGSGFVVAQEQGCADQLVSIHKAGSGGAVQDLAMRAVGVPSSLNSSALF